jgi:carbon monoxide dehydrogenase subunit G
MEIANRFTVDAPPEIAYEALIDLERIGPCIPGATIGPAEADGAHPAQIAVKLGPMRMTYAGTVRIVEQDRSARRAVLAADVKEARGQGSARATMTMHVGEDGPGASVDSATEVQMTGRAAQMGRGLIEDVAERLVKEMADNLGALLDTPAPAPSPGAADAAPPPPAARPVNGLGLVARVIASRIAWVLGLLASRAKRLFNRTR